MRRAVNMLLAGIFFWGLCTSAGAQQGAAKGTVTLSGAWAVYPTAVAWGAAFEKTHPNVKVEVSAGGAGKGAADAIAGLVDIGMVSREPDPAEIQRGINPIFVLHDAVFGVVSANNVLLPELRKKGLKKQALQDMYLTGAATTWDQILPGAPKRPIHVYTRSDSCGAAASWAAYLGKKQEDLKGVGIYGDPGVLETVQRDPVGLGFANFSYVFGRDGKVLPGVALLPLDADGNGTADAGEVLADRAAAVKAIEAGSYPVARKNYFFVKGKPSGLVLEFLRFCLSDEGIRVVNQVGTSLPLPPPDREKVLKSIS
jgi:phosphate transport system substrate-binding protein